jgi:hypothetical protein
MYGLQRPSEKKIYPPLGPKIYTPPAQLQQTVNTQRGVSCVQATKTSYTPTQIDDVQYINKPTSKTAAYMILKKYFFIPVYLQSVQVHSVNWLKEVDE